MRILSFLLLLCLATGIVFAEDGDVAMQKMPLADLIDYVSQRLQIPILYDDTVTQQTVFISNVEKLSDDRLLQIFQSLLAYHGHFTATLGEGNKRVFKIAKIADAPWTPTPLLHDYVELSKLVNRDVIVTMLISLRHITVKEFLTVLQRARLIHPRGATISGIASINTILVCDYAPNVKRIYEIAQLVDTPPAVKCILLQHAQAEVVAEVLRELFASPEKRIKIVAAPHLNLLILRALEKDLTEIVPLVQFLDREPVKQNPPVVEQETSQSN